MTRKSLFSVAVFALLTALLFFGCDADDAPSTHSTDSGEPGSGQADDDGADSDDDLDDDTADDDTGEYFPHEEMFETILRRLVDEFWDESGDWREDMMHEATSFAPEFLFEYGADTANDAMIEMARATCMWELELFSRLLDGDLSSLYPTGMGAIAILWGWFNDVDPRFDALFFLGVPAGSIAVSLFYQAVADLLGVFPAASFLGLMAHVHNLVADNETGAVRMAAIEESRRLIGIAYENVWDDLTGLFEGDETFHGQLAASGVMLIAVAEAARITQDPDLLAKAEDLYAAMDESLWDVDQGGYWDSLDHTGKYLSTTVMTLRGVVSLYEATGDEQYRERAEAFLDWIEEYLYFEGICRHDWTVANGRAESFCTGCNFILIYDMYMLHKLGSQ